MSEIKEIPGYEGLYGVTRDGLVWSYKLNRFLKPSIGLRGYCCVKLYRNGRWNGYSVQRLIMAAYGNLDINDTQMVAHHIDGNKSNNKLENLQIMTKSKHSSNHSPMRAKGYKVNTKTHKLCTKCEILKLRSEFNIARNRPDGSCDWCKSCLKEYRERNRDKIIEYGQKYCERNQDKIIEYKQKYYQKLKEKRQHV